MTGHEYADLIAEYILHNFAERGIALWREVDIGKSFIGKNRRLDLFILREDTNEAFAIECKYQEVQGTVDEKIPYALEDIKRLNMGGCIVYAGPGFSPGVLHMLESSEVAAYCSPDPKNLASSRETRELDHALALHFKWWDVLVRDKKPFARTTGSTG